MKYLDTAVKNDLLKELKQSVTKALEYLANSKFLSPQMRTRTRPGMADSLIFLARELKRFSESMMENLSVQIN